MVTLDLLTTNNLFYFHPLLYEANILGNIPLLEYSIFPLFILIYLYGLKYNIFKLINNKILMGIAFLPIIAVINNLFFIFFYL